jgi:hypothetical protein
MERSLKQAVDRGSACPDIPAVVDGPRVQPARKKIGAIIEEPFGQSEVECGDVLGSWILLLMESRQLDAEPDEIIIRGPQSLSLRVAQRLDEVAGLPIQLPPGGPERPIIPLAVDSLDELPARSPKRCWRYRAGQG